MSEKTFTVAKPEDFDSVIEYIFSASSANKNAQLVTLTGDLGAGKTTFVQQLAKHLGVEEIVVSPTFVVMKSYDIPEPVAAAGGAAGRAVKNPQGFSQLVHIDAYRFEDPSEAGPLRLEELFKDPENLICLEWPERVADILPKERTEVTIEIGEGEERKVMVRY